MSFELRFILNKALVLLFENYKGSHGHGAFDKVHLTWYVDKTNL